MLVTCRTTIIAGCVVFIVGVVLLFYRLHPQDSACSWPAVSCLAGSCRPLSSCTCLRLLLGKSVAPSCPATSSASRLDSCWLPASIMAVYATQSRTDSGSYRIPIAIEKLWALTLGTGLLPLPKSPRYFVKKGQLDRAAQCENTQHKRRIVCRYKLESAWVSTLATVKMAGGCVTYILIVQNAGCFVALKVFAQFEHSIERGLGLLKCSHW